jgi:hypothetical protein
LLGDTSHIFLGNQDKDLVLEEFKLFGEELVTVGEFLKMV